VLQAIVTNAPVPIEDVKTGAPGALGGERNAVWEGVECTRGGGGNKPIPGEKEIRFPRSTGVRGSRARCSLIEKSDRVPVYFCRLARAYGGEGVGKAGNRHQHFVGGVRRLLKLALLAPPPLPPASRAASCACTKGYRVPPCGIGAPPAVSSPPRPPPLRYRAPPPR
jgi:hypothetical protein